MAEIDKIINQNKRLFWDKTFLDSDTDKYIIVERVLERGTEGEFKAVLAFYGEEFIKKVVSQSRNLSPKTVNYFSMVFGIPREATRCFSEALPPIWRPY